MLGYHPATAAGVILGTPQISWADDAASQRIIDLLARAAAAAALPDLPSGVPDQRAGAS